MNDCPFVWLGVSLRKEVLINNYLSVWISNPDRLNYFKADALFVFMHDSLIVWVQNCACLHAGTYSWTILSYHIIVSTQMETQMQRQRIVVSPCLPSTCSCSALPPHHPPRLPILLILHLAIVPAQNPECRCNSEYRAQHVQYFYSIWVTSG